MSRTEKALIGALAGATVGAAVGALAKKGTGAAIGAVLGGGIGGGGTYALTAPTATPATPQTPATPSLPTIPTIPTIPVPTSAWRRLQPTDMVKAGQQLAFAIEGPNRTALTPDLIAQFQSSLPSLVSSYGATTGFTAYPPGTPLPPDWPSDDDLGAGAYRGTVQTLVDAPTAAANWAFPPSNVATAEVWIR